MMNKILTSLSKLFLPGIRLKRWLLVMIIGLVSLILFFMSTFGKAVANVFDFLESKLALIFSLGNMGGGQKLLVKVALLLIGLGCLYLGTKHVVGRLIDALMPEKKGKIAHLLYKSSELNQGKNVVVIGGGTGLNSILTGLKQYTNNITAIITIADEGRSSRILRNEFGMLPPGDFRNCLVALSDSGPLMAKLLQYRFQKGKGLKGHPLGNLLITAMTHLTGDFLREKLKRFFRSAEKCFRFQLEKQASVRCWKMEKRSVKSRMWKNTKQNTSQRLKNSF